MGRSTNPAVQAKAKNKTIIGDYASTGANTMLEAPITIPAHTVIASRSFIPANTPIPPYSLVIETQRPKLSKAMNLNGMSIKPNWVKDQYKKYDVPMNVTA